MPPSVLPDPRALPLLGGAVTSAVRAAGSVADVPLRPLAPVREGIAAGVRAALTGSSHPAAPGAAFTEPAGDPGWFGPDSVAWRVHADLPGMLVGGVSALFLQALHPLAMAGVAEHSAYREDPTGRLARTGAFIGVTTYGSSTAAEEACGVIDAVHSRVRGVAPDGRPYAASDPELVTWIHAAEVGSFLRGYQRFGGRPLRRVDCDRYLDETAVVAERLGGADVPRSTAALRRYFRAVRPELTGGAQALEARDFLFAGPGGRPEQRVAYSLVVRAGVDLLPDWARRMLRIHRPPVVGRLADPLVVRPATFAVGEVLRWSLGESPALAAARARVVGVGADRPAA